MNGKTKMFLNQNHYQMPMAKPRCFQTRTIIKCQLAVGFTHCKKKDVLISNTLFPTKHNRTVRIVDIIGSKKDRSFKCNIRIFFTYNSFEKATFDIYPSSLITNVFR